MWSKAAAVVTHMGLHSHKLLRVPTLTLILMVAGSFSRWRHPVANPKILRKSLRWVGGVDFAYTFPRSQFNHLWDDGARRTSPAESESADILVSDTTAHLLGSSRIHASVDQQRYGSKCWTRLMLILLYVSSVQINTHVSFSWQDERTPANSPNSCPEIWKSVPETIKSLFDVMILLRVEAAAASAAGLIIFWWPVSVHCLKRCQKPCSRLFCIISPGGVHGGHFTSSETFTAINDACLPFCCRLL